MSPCSTHTHMGSKMKAIAGLILGGFFGAFAFFVIHYEQLLLSAKGQAGLLLTLQLNNAGDNYMIGGAFAGLLIVLINTIKK